MHSGKLALILHAHLPFVRHPEHPSFLEEDWFFEAITESYIPLLAMMQRLVEDRVPFKLTMTVTPPLCAMLGDELLRQRYVRYLNQSIELAGREMERNRRDPSLLPLAEFYHARFCECRKRFVDDWNCDLLAVFRALRDTGSLEIIASAATHGLLPLLQQSPAAVRAQVLIGCDVYRAAFSESPKGFWLPECAYAPGLDQILQEANLRWFVLDAHGLIFANQRPHRAIYSPCYTPAGPAAFGRDRASSRQVWSSHEGYPGDPSYRDFYRDIGFELPATYLWPDAPDTSAKFTGIKYHRVTGKHAEKEPYNIEWARKTATAHAAHFAGRMREEISELPECDFDPIIVTPFDAELFGHWWFEGPQFLEAFIRNVRSEDSGLRLTTPTAYLVDNPTQQTISPVASTWGENGHLAVWLDDSNAWIYPHLHAAARRMIEVARAYASEATPLAVRGLKQMARELLLMQSSDWAFLMKTGTARHYAAHRTTRHILRFNKLYDQLLHHEIDERFVADCEWRDNLFADVNWRHYI